MMNRSNPGTALLAPEPRLASLKAGVAALHEQLLAMVELVEALDAEVDVSEVILSL